MLSAADVDECAAGTAQCEENSFCVDTEGSYKCSCKNGFKREGDVCVDEDECANDAHFCDEHAECINTIGGHKCVCKEGYQGSGEVCEKTVGPCDSAPCGVNGLCHPEGEAFYCECHAGFETVDGVCADVDECATGADSCSEHATCENTEGSFTCKCNPGYTGDGHSCQDIDECATNSANCDINAVCTNTPGSFTCQCATGFTGDGLHCEQEVLHPDQMHCRGWTAWTECKDGALHSTRVCSGLPSKVEVRECPEGNAAETCGDWTEWSPCPGAANNMTSRSRERFGEEGCEEAHESLECPNEGEAAVVEESERLSPEKRDAPRGRQGLVRERPCLRASVCVQNWKRSAAPSASGVRAEFPRAACASA